MTYIPPLNGKRISIKADSNSSIETGVVTLASGSNVTLGQSGSTITITSSALNPAGDVAAVGTIQMYAGSSAPTGWAICDGSAVSRTTYSALFTAIGTTYGAGDGSTTFNLPDLRARVPVGAGTGTLVLTFSSRSSNVITVTGADNIADNEIQTGTAVAYTSSGTNIGGLATGTYYIVRQSNTSFSLASSQANAIAGTVITLTSDGTGTRTFTITVGTKTLGYSGGEERHSLVVNETPSHTHTQNSHNHTQDAHNHGSATGAAFVLAGGAGNIQNGSFYGFNFAQTLTGTTTATNQAATATNQNTGGSADHNNLQPYVVINYIIKLLSSAVGTGSNSSVVSIATKTSNYSLSTSDMTILADATSGNVTLTLPSASSTSGQVFYIKRIDSSANTVTISRSGSDTIDGMTSFTLDQQYTVSGLVSNGSAWYIL